MHTQCVNPATCRRPKWVHVGTRSGMRSVATGLRTARTQHVTRPVRSEVGLWQCHWMHTCVMHPVEIEHTTSHGSPRWLRPHWVTAPCHLPQPKGACLVGWGRGHWCGLPQHAVRQACPQQGSGGARVGENLNTGAEQHIQWCGPGHTCRKPDCRSQAEVCTAVSAGDHPGGRSHLASWCACVSTRAPETHLVCHSARVAPRPWAGWLAS